MVPLLFQSGISSKMLVHWLMKKVSFLFYSILLFLLISIHFFIFFFKESSNHDGDSKTKVKGLTKVFGGPKLNLDNVKGDKVHFILEFFLRFCVYLFLPPFFQQGSSQQPNHDDNPGASALISGPVIGDMEPDLAENYEPYVLVHLWDRPKVIYEYAAKVQGSAALLDSFMTKLQKVCFFFYLWIFWSFLFYNSVINDFGRLKRLTLKAWLNWQLRYFFLYFLPSFFFV